MMNLLPQKRKESLDPICCRKMSCWRGFNSAHGEIHCGGALGGCDAVQNRSISVGWGLGHRVAGWRESVIDGVPFEGIRSSLLSAASENVWTSGAEESAAESQSSATSSSKSRVLD